jgi:hypothetical protein
MGFKIEVCRLVSFLSLSILVSYSNKSLKERSKQHTVIDYKTERLYWRINVNEIFCVGENSKPGKKGKKMLFTPNLCLT